MTVFSELFIPQKGPREHNDFWLLVAGLLGLVIGLMLLDGTIVSWHQNLNPNGHARDAFDAMIVVSFASTFIGTTLAADRIFLLSTWRRRHRRAFLAWVQTTPFPLAQYALDADRVIERPGGRRIRPIPVPPGTPVMVMFPHAKLIPSSLVRHAYVVDPGDRLDMYAYRPIQEALTLVHDAVRNSDPGLYIGRIHAGLAPAAP